MQYTCYGAAQEVTGSCHLIEAAGKRVLLDCGLIQGSPEDEERNALPFPFDPSNIDAVILSHAHIDHSGRLPLLIKQGFSGPVYTHRASMDLCHIMLRDAAFINEKEAERENRRLERKNKRTGNNEVEPLYDRDDAAVAMQHFEGILYDQKKEIFPGITLRLQDAGHILGAAIVEVWLQENEKQCKLVFSGDLGHHGRPILRDPAFIKNADIVLMESTYGDRLHRDWEATYAELKEIFFKTRKEKGNILIPAFAVGRTQALIYLFTKYHQEWDLGQRLIFLDSPMAIDATEVYFKYPELYRPEAAKFWQPGQHHDVSDNLHYTRSPEESIRLNDITGGAIIIAGSGMCTGGRIRHHLRHNIGRKDCHVVIVGYQGQGTVGRALVDGAPEIRLWGKPYRVAATIHTVGGLSAHADQGELVDWVQHFNKKPPVWLVHGEPDAQSRLKATLENKSGVAVEIMQAGETRELPAA